ncbi:MAG: pyridoxal phosphate-dependent aminotransferase family protein [Bacteroidales bacterium]|jgi:7-keto-8-aminopelargonate synthetase-like enzyme|nr:pyridoxal phosphate-dependent aminotransferase family protein [Bacteroidales bacterium]
MVLSGGVGNYVLMNGRKYSYFGGNNYLGLANHPEIKKAAADSVKKYGVNFSASRRTTGTADIHLELEKALSDFKGKQDTAIFASGYLGNSILLEILKDNYTSIFIDKLAHASIIAGIPRDMDYVFFYDHCDPAHLDQLIARHLKGSLIVVTDGVFALTGDVAPLDKIYPIIKKYNGLLVVDDAHSTGILGRTGKGTPEYFNLPDDESIYQTETMSKALGSYGGFISGTRALTDLIREKSTTYQASTSLPPPIVAAGLASMKIIKENPGFRISLHEKSVKLRNEITATGFKTTNNPTPIIPVLTSSKEEGMNLSAFMEEEGIIAPYMNYPSQNEAHIVRLTVSVSHSWHQIETLLKMLRKWKKLQSKK